MSFTTNSFGGFVTHLPTLSVGHILSKVEPAVSSLLDISQDEALGSGSVQQNS